jgi:hypothetical protein
MSSETCNFSLGHFIALTGCARGSVNDSCGIFSSWSIYGATAAITVRVPSRSFLCFRWQCHCLVGGTKLHFGSQLLTRPALSSRESASFSQCVLAGFGKVKSLNVARDQKKTLATVRCVLLCLPFLLQPLTSIFTFPGSVAILTPDEEVMKRRFPSISAKCCVLQFQLIW